MRRSDDGRVEVLLVTSRETKRWVIPKGWPWPDCADHRAAAEEAREEAGVSGDIGKTAIGHFSYVKRLENGSVRVKVDVYLLDVTRERNKWPEKKERNREWFTPARAASLVQERALKTLIRALEKRLP